MLFIISFIFLFFLLFSFKFYLSSQVKTQDRIIFNKQKEINLSSQFQDFKQVVQETNNELKNIQIFYKRQILIAPILKNISELIPSSIYFTKFSTSWPDVFEENPNYLMKLSIQGYAENREDLFLFQKALKQSEYFEEVNVSLQSWLKPVDVNFYIDIKIK
jgi:Tfp pilus assembly protein PilN